MSKASIVILILCTAVIVAVVFFSLRKDPGIEDIYLVNSENIEEAGLENTENKDFYSLDSKIHLVVSLKDVTSEDSLEIEWVFSGKDSKRLIQEDNIKIDKNGSGITTVYLIRKDNAYTPGEYEVRVKYNSIQEREMSFTIKPGSSS